MSIYFYKGKTFSLIGPQIDELSKLNDVVDYAREQLSRENTSILVLGISDLMGNMGALKRRIQELFESEQNKKFNAILLLSYFYLPEGINTTLLTIRNPFCASPLPESFYAIIKERRDELLAY
jgi:hypothetical protein